MILFITETLGLSFNTIAGVNVGFEIIGPLDFAKTTLPLRWSLLMNFGIVRLTLSKYIDE